MIIIVCTVFISQTALSGLLDQYAWKNRPLLIFAPSESDRQFQRMQSLLKHYSCQLNDRHMLTGYILHNGSARLDSHQLDQQAVTALQNQFSIDPSRFAVLLIGKDGDVKYANYSIPDMNEIFALIDGMPMRQDEMQENPTSCPDPVI